MGETRVDLLHLLEDLRDAYPGATEETVLTEIVANALDSGADTISVTTDSMAGTVALVDNGTGMRRRELARYHDLASTTKVRGSGIGFAGVGMKIALLVCDEVTTETRSRRHHVATTWHLASRHRAPWRWIPPAGLVPERGTAVRLRPSNALSPLLDRGFIETGVRRHFQALFDPRLTEILSPHYPRGVRFVINGDALDQEDGADLGDDVASIAIHMGRRRRPSASGYIVRERQPVDEERRGIAISTFGKVIKRGWDWVGMAPAAADHVTGILEAPALAECLTLNKVDFIRAGARGSTYLAYRKAIQEAVSRQLAAWGDTVDTATRARRRAARPLERDLERVLTDLAAEFPLLSSLVEHRARGQRQLSLGRSASGSAPIDLSVALQVREPRPEEARLPVDQPAAGDDGGRPGDGPSPASVAASSDAGARRDQQDRPLRSSGDAYVAGRRGPGRTSRLGLAIQFEQREADVELARLVESTVWVNEAHPAYRRAVASRSEGYHTALAAAMALASVAVEPTKEHAFITAFLASWGDAVGRQRRRRAR